MELRINRGGAGVQVAILVVGAEGVYAQRRAADLVSDGLEHVVLVGALEHKLDEVGNDAPVHLASSGGGLVVGAHQRKAFATVREKLFKC